MENKPRVTELIVWDEFGKTNLQSPELRLWGAVIQRAVLDLLTTSKADAMHRRSARIFLFSDDPKLSPLRFYAEMMFTDPDAFIERLRKAVRSGALRPKQVAYTS